jgi:hypothetical protein
VHPADFVLWNSFTPVKEDQKIDYPIAEFVPTGYGEDGMLSESRIETNRFEIRITDTSRHRVWDLARATKQAIEQIDDADLVESSAEIEDFATPWDGGGKRIVWEIKLAVTIQIFVKG